MGKSDLVLLAFIFGLFIFLSGCLGEQPTCNKPYILVGTDCCLDANDNGICDSDEAAPTQNITTEQNMTPETEVSPNITGNITPETGNGQPETPFCNPPYYEYKRGDCCLDTNDNQICDSDETVPANQTGNGQQETGNETDGGIEIMPTAQCGDGICSDGEDPANCCKDCNCPSGEICLINTCTEFKGFVTPDIKVTRFCGDGSCTGSENSSNCCIDCGCPTGFNCFNNTCLASMVHIPMTIIPISPEKKLTNDTVTELAKPRVSDYFVAWNEYFSGDSDIMLYNLQTDNRVRLASPSTQYHPDISGKRLVWTDYRRPVQGDNSDIYYYDIVSGAEGFVTSRIEYKWGGAIDGNYITWIEQDGYKKYVYLFNLASSTETKLTPSDIYPQGLDVSGSNVVWGWFNCDTGTCHYGIQLYNIGTKKKTDIIETTGDIDVYNIRIHGNKVVYISGKDQYSQVNVYDISTKLTTQITSALGEKNYPSIYQNTVVWQDKRGGNWDIYMYDLVSKKETALVSESHDQQYPDVYGNKVVYQDRRSGRHIYMYTLSS